MTSSSVTASFRDVLIPKTNAMPVAIVDSRETNGLINFTISRKVLWLLSKKFSGSRFAASFGKNSPNSKKINAVAISNNAAEKISSSSNFISVEIVGTDKIAHMPAKIPVKVIPI